MKKTMSFILAGYVAISPMVIFSAESRHPVGLMPFSNRVFPDSATRVEAFSEVKNRDFDYIENVIPDMLLSEFYEDGRYEILERSRVEDLLREIKFGETGAVDPDLAAKAGKLLGSGHLVYGTISRQGNNLFLTPRVLEVTKRINKTAGVIQFSEKDIFMAIPKLKELVQKIVPPSKLKQSEMRLTPGLQIACLPFNDTSKRKTEPDLRVRVPDLMLNDMIGLKGASFVERMRIEVVFKELKLNQSGLVDEATALKVGRLVGAKAIVFGSFMIVGDNIRIDARTSEVETGRLLAAAKSDGKLTDVKDCVSAVAVKLKKRLSKLIR